MEFIYVSFINVLVLLFKLTFENGKESDFLIGCMKNQITGSKLLSRGDVLRVLYFNINSNEFMLKFN